MALEVNSTLLDFEKWKNLGLLRYPVDFAAQEYISDDDDFDLDDYWHGFISSLKSFPLKFHETENKPKIDESRGWLLATCAF